MDFSKDIMDKQGYGNYTNLPIRADELPLFFLCYLSDPSDSGKIHSTVRQRFDAGDEVNVVLLSLLTPFFNGDTHWMT